jgi:type IV pilus assembly protein PilX
MQSKAYYRIGNERGAALIVALLLLLVMTILGVTALNSSTLQGLMSSAYRQQTSVLAGAENILLAAERRVDEIVTDGAPVDTGWTYFIDLTLDTSPEEFPAGSSAEDWSDAVAVAAQGIGSFEIPGRYMLEYMGEFEVPGESIAEGGGLEDSRIHVFRVSAQAEEQQGAAARIVQSYYVALRSPNE